MALFNLQEQARLGAYERFATAFENFCFVPLYVDLNEADVTFVEAVKFFQLNCYITMRNIGQQ